jgi:hypothetical protein
VAIIDLLNRTPLEDPGKAFEGCCARLLPAGPSDQIIADGAHVRVSANDPGEIDILATTSTSELLMIECKSAGVQRSIDTTVSAFEQVIGKAARQLQSRMSAFLGGEPIRYGHGEINWRPETSVSALIVTQHEYGGLIWHGQMNELIPELRGIAVIAVHDLAILGYALRSSAEFGDYLRWRAATIEASYALDEIDILRAYLRVRTGSMRIGVGPAAVPATKLPPAAALGVEPPFASSQAFREFVRRAPDIDLISAR